MNLKSKMMFSIIVPIYNTEQYLEECLDSVLGQEYSEYECVLVNDGSTDSSAEICRKYCNKDVRFRLLEQKNSGLSAARNAGIRYAGGEFIVFLDSDDFLKKEALKNLAERIQQNPEENAIISTTFAYYEDTGELKERHWEPEKTLLTSAETLWSTFEAEQFIVAAWTLTVRRSWLIVNQLFFEPGLLHEDELWFPQVVTAAGQVVVNRDPFYCGRCNRQGSIANTPNIKRIYDKIHIAQSLENLAENKKLADCEGALKLRSAQIMVNVVKSLNAYNDSRLNAKAKESMCLLKRAPKSKYRILFYMCCVLGVNSVSKLLNRA